MKRAFLFLVLIVVFLSLVAGQADLEVCFPDYKCSEWSDCDGVFQYRTCEDVACGNREVNEKLFCGITERVCEPEFVCTEWGQCVYTEKSDNVISGVISFGGYRNRVCRDKNICVKDFVDESTCEEALEFQLIILIECGESFLVARNIETGRQMIKISLDALEKNKLNIVTSQSEVVFCPQCYNAVLDGNEEKIDCGGECKPCREETGKVWVLTIRVVAWLLSLLFFILSITEVMLEVLTKKAGKK